MSMSNRARRMMQHQLRNKADAELNLIPMIDIMSVMVSFLLVYSTEVQVVENPKGIEVPQSISQQKPRETVVITLTKDEVYVQGEAVASIDEVRASTTTVVAPLSVALKRPTMSGQPLTDKEIADREITVLADKSLPYEVLKKIMSTCTDADYGKISFALLQKDKPVSADSLRHSS
jgi:biopolymer transport protein TolR